MSVDTVGSGSILLLASMVDRWDGHRAWTVWVSNIEKQGE